MRFYFYMKRLSQMGFAFDTEVFSLVSASMSKHILLIFARREGRV
jgi:hypothetical protein